MKCLVTGAGGFVGSALTRRLVQEGHHVRVFLRRKEAVACLNKLSLEIYIGDILCKDDLQEATRDIDVVFHAASLYDATPFYSKRPERLYQVNVEGTRNLCEMALKGGVKKLIYTSSTATVGLEKSSLDGADETVKLNEICRRSHYELSKSEAEDVVLSFDKKGLFVVSINPSFIIGPGDGRPTPTGEILVKYLNQKYPCYPKAFVCLSGLSAVVEAHIKAMTHAASGQRYIVTDDQVWPIKKVFKKIEEITGIRSPMLQVPPAVLFPISWLNEILLRVFCIEKKIRPLISMELLRYLSLGCKYNGAKSRHAFNITDHNIETEIKLAIDWYVRNGFVKRKSRITYFRKIGKL